MKKNTISTAIVILISVFNLFFATGNNNEPDPDAITGTWLMPDNEGIIEIYRQDNMYQGKIIWLKDKEADGTPLKDSLNPVDSLKNRNIVGIKVMNNFVYTGNGTWSKGTFYAAKKGKWVEPDFIMRDPDHLNIEISFFIFSKSIELTRIDTTAFFKQFR